MPLRPASRALTVGLALCALGCDGDSARRPGGATTRRPGSAILCRPPGDSVISVAVREYVQRLEPKPRRFLVAIGSDSALPDAGRQALQNRGPTYLFPADPAKQAEVRQKLTREFGEVRTLLVLYGGMRQPDQQTAVVRLSGRIVGGADDGQRTPPRAMHFSCETARWHFARADEERQA